MKLLHPIIPPLTESYPNERATSTFQDQFIEELRTSDSLEIAVGYISRFSLEELDRLVSRYNIRKVCLIIGMYYIEGMPESSYRTAMRINQKWMELGIGEIRLVKALKFHGKCYYFGRENHVSTAIIGSDNLGSLVTDANNRRQYEVSLLIDDNVREVLSIRFHIQDLKSNQVSSNISDIQDLKLIHEQNVSLTGIDTVTPVPQADVDAYRRYTTETSFALPLKVPRFEERFMDDGRHYTKSNINVCYAAPRYARKPRDWYEIQMTVSRDITTLPGYPEKNKTFYVVTDDGYRFKAHTTSDGNKQFNAVGDELLIGRWLKGRLAAAGLVNPVNDTRADTQRLGMITQEMLEEYGCHCLLLTKTTKTIFDEDGTEYDVWLLSMENAPEN